MNKTTVIIPSATLVSEELQKIGKLPGIIYPVNQRIVFDYLYEQYREYCRAIDVLCYQSAEKVYRRLLKYVGSFVNIKKLNRIVDLGHTLYDGLKDIEGSCIINFADTIVFDNIFEHEGDAFFYAEDFMSDKWTYFDIENGVVSEIYDKVQTVDIEEKKKLFVGVFQFTDSIYFRSCLEEAFRTDRRDMSTFYYALCLYSQRYSMQALPTNNWFDIGHAETYYNTKLEVKAREFNHITIDRDRGILKKTSNDKGKFIGEILWYLKLPSDLEYVCPRIFSYSTAYAAPYVSMEYYAYHTIHELYLYGDLSKHQWEDIFRRIRFVYNDFRRHSLEDKDIRSSLEDMYLVKTQERLGKMRIDERFAHFFSMPIEVNGVNYHSLDDIVRILEDIIPKLLYDVERFHIIHGDLCFANIMVDDNCTFIKVIDPRGKFGNSDIYGDSRYELAKLFHSIDGKYDYIIKDLFTVRYDLDTAKISYQISDRDRSFNLYRLFMETFKVEIGGELRKIELIEALLFISMIPLHGENLNHQMVMLGTGLDILDRVVNIKISND